MSTKVKMEPEEEVQPSTSGGDVQPQQQPETVEKIVKEASNSEDTLDSDDIDDEFLTQYCETVKTVQPMTVSKELFYTDSMVARNYEWLSEEKKRFNQMKELAESAKQETGEYSLIEDLMARIVGERYGAMKVEDVEAVMGKPGKGAEGGKHVKKEGSHLTIKSEPGAEAEKVVISAIVPAEESTLLPYCVKEAEEEDCETIGTDSDVEEINKEEVRNVLKELAGLKRREAECYDRLAKAVPDMQENEVVIVAEKVRGTELPQCVYQMNQRIGNPRDFRAVLAAGERLYSMHKYHQAGTPPVSIPELCMNFDVGKTKIYDLLRGEKYRYPPKEEVEKRPARRIQPEKVEAEEPPTKKVKKAKAIPTT